MTGWSLTETVVGFALVFLAAVALTRPAYRANRFLLGVAVAAFAVGVVGVAVGLQG